jgi:hypothetical protein
LKGKPIPNQQDDRLRLPVRAILLLCYIGIAILHQHGTSARSNEEESGAGHRFSRGDNDIAASVSVSPSSHKFKGWATTDPIFSLLSNGATDRAGAGLYILQQDMFN